MVGANNNLSHEFAVWRGVRLSADFCLQLVQRTILLATIQTASRLTGSVFISVVEALTLVFIFVWVAYSGKAAFVWLKIQTFDRPDMRRFILVMGILLELLLVCVLFIASTSFANTMAEQLRDI